MARTKYKYYILKRPPVEYPGKRYRRGYVYEHQLVWWQNTGEVVDDRFVIHHKNGDTTDNRFMNLEKETRASHSRGHARTKKMIELTCARCGKSFARSLRSIKPRLKLGQKLFYCCHHHGRSTSRKDIPHGTDCGYCYHKCRCSLCREAHAEKHRKYRQKLRRE
jgi:hypothetical protein